MCIVGLYKIITIYLNVQIYKKLSFDNEINSTYPMSINNPLITHYQLIIYIFEKCNFIYSRVLFQKLYITFKQSY